MSPFHRFIMTITSVILIAMILACGGAANKPQNAQSDNGIKKDNDQPKAVAAAADKAARRKFEGLLRTLRSIESDVEHGTTQKLLNLHLRQLSTELKLVSGQMHSDPEIEAYNQFVKAVDAYQASDSLWQVKDASAQAGEHYAKSKANLRMTIPQLEAMQKGESMVRVASVNFNWDITKSIDPYKLNLHDIDGVTFAPADALQVIWSHAVAATNKAENLLR